MNRTERYEGSDHHVYMIEFFEGSYVARIDEKVYVEGSCPDDLPSSLSWAEAARLGAIAKIEDKIKKERAARKKLVAD